MLCTVSLYKQRVHIAPVMGAELSFRFRADLMVAGLYYSLLHPASFKFQTQAHPAGFKNASHK